MKPFISISKFIEDNKDLDKVKLLEKYDELHMGDKEEDHLCEMISISLAKKGVIKLELTNIIDMDSISEEEFSVMRDAADKITRILLPKLAKGIDDLEQ